MVAKNANASARKTGDVMPSFVLKMRQPMDQ
jgi:hypothetical protein